MKLKSFGRCLAIYLSLPLLACSVQSSENNFLNKKIGRPVQKKATGKVDKNKYDDFLTIPIPGELKLDNATPKTLDVESMLPPDKPDENDNQLEVGVSSASGEQRNYFFFMVWALLNVANSLGVLKDLEQNSKKELKSISLLNKNFNLKKRNISSLMNYLASHKNDIQDSLRSFFGPYAFYPDKDGCVYDLPRLASLIIYLFANDNCENKYLVDVLGRSFDHEFRSITHDEKLFSSFVNRYKSKEKYTSESSDCYKNFLVGILNAIFDTKKLKSESDNNKKLENSDNLGLICYYGGLEDKPDNKNGSNK